MKKGFLLALACVGCLLLCAGCGGDAGPKTKTRSEDSSKTRVKDISKMRVKDIERDLVGEKVGDEIVAWVFAEDEPRSISIVETEEAEETASIVIEMETQSEATDPLPALKMKGKLRLQYERVSGKWELARIEDVSFRAI